MMPTTSEMIWYLGLTAVLVFTPYLHNVLLTHVPSNQEALQSPLLSRIGGLTMEMLFWASIGCLIYILYWATVNFGSLFIGDVMTAYRNKHAHHPLIRILKVITLYAACICLAVELMVIQFGLLVPLYLLLLSSGLSTSFLFIVRTIVSILIVVSIHMYIVTLRLITQRDYIFKKS